MKSSASGRRTEDMVHPRVLVVAPALGLGLPALLLSASCAAEREEPPELGTIGHSDEQDPGYFTVPPYDPDEVLFDAINAVREAAGLSPVAEDERLGDSAQKHADFLAAAPAAMGYQEETFGGQALGGYTGSGPAQRAIEAAYEGILLDEVIAFRASSAAAIREWLDSLYHRVPLLDPRVDEYGFGEAVVDGVITFNVLDLGRGGIGEPPQRMVHYPAEGATDVPFEWSGNESPQPPPPPAGYPSGTVITLQSTRGTFDAITATVTPDGGAGVAATIYTRDNGVWEAVNPGTTDPIRPSVICVIPHEPLDPDTTYTVDVEGDIDEDGTITAVDETWSFTTRSPVCDVVGQECGPGLGCFPLGGDPVCDYSGPGGMDAVCGSIKDCAAGLTCLAERCRPLCRTDLDLSDSGSCDARCQYGLIEVPGTTNIAACLQPACVFDPSVCLEEQACYFASGWICETAGTLGPFEKCQFLNDCEPGLLCLGVGGVNRCRAVCGGAAFGDCEEVCPKGSQSLDEESNTRHCKAE